MGRQQQLRQARLGNLSACLGKPTGRKLELAIPTPLDVIASQLPVPRPFLTQRMPATATAPPSSSRQRYSINTPHHPLRPPLTADTDTRLAVPRLLRGSIPDRFLLRDILEDVPAAS